MTPHVPSRFWVGLFAGVLLLTVACADSGDSPTPAAPDEPSAPAGETVDTETDNGEGLEIALTVATIDGADVVEGRSEGQQKIQVGGTVSSDAVTVCVLVRPPVLDSWFVQPPPTVEPSADGGFRWSSPAFLGTKDLGEGDLFEVKAIAEAEAEVCQPRNRAEDTDLGGVLASSETVKVLRLPAAPASE